MTKALDRVMKEIRTLSVEEMQRVREQLDDLIASHTMRTQEDELERRLLAAGVISEIRPRTVDLTPYKERKPIQVVGPPISETLIEERR